MATTPPFHDDDDDANLVAVSTEETHHRPGPRGGQRDTGRPGPGGRSDGRGGGRGQGRGSGRGPAGKKRKPLRPQTPDWLSSPAITFFQSVGLAALAIGGLYYSGVFHSITTNTVSIKYLGGKSPIDASVDVARRDFGRAKTVLIVQQDDFIDGTLAAGLSGAMQAPLLLSATDALTPRTLDVIREINPERVILLGGEVLLSPNIQQQLEQQVKVQVNRFAGVDMQNTMIAVNQEVARLTREEFGQASRRGVLVDPNTLFNAAAAGAIAADWKHPASVLIANGEQASAETDQVVSALAINEVFALNASITGPTAYPATSLTALADAKTKQDGERMSSIILVPQDDTHRAMLAAPAAGRAGGVVLPVNNEETWNWLRGTCPKVTTMTLLAPDGQFVEEYNRAIEAMRACGFEIENPKSSVTITGPAPQTAQPVATPTAAPIQTPTIPSSTVAPEAPAVTFTEDPQAIQDALAPAAPEG